MLYTFNASTWETEAGQAQPPWYSEFQDKKNYVEQPFLLKKKKKFKSSKELGL